MLKKILNDSKNKIAKQSKHQFYAYAGHDSTLSNLLITLGVWDQQIPTYNMLALLELHEAQENIFYFKVYIRISLVNQNSKIFLFINFFRYFYATNRILAFTNYKYLSAKKVHVL